VGATLEPLVDLEEVSYGGDAIKYYFLNSITYYNKFAGSIHNGSLLH
jgi:hypothetical protein